MHKCGVCKDSFMLWPHVPYNTCAALCMSVHLCCDMQRGKFGSCFSYLTISFIMAEVSNIFEEKGEEVFCKRIECEGVVERSENISYLVIGCF